MSEASAPARPRHPAVTAAITIGGFAALLWVIEIIDTITGSALQRGGVQPRELDGLIGILWAPMLHDDWGHLIANTGPLLVLGFVILLSGVRTWLGATGIIWVIGGFGTWLTGGPNTVHIGASVLVFGWVTFLILRGVFARNWLQITVGVLVLLGYGGVLFGVFPGEQGVSWQGHLFGAIGGVVAAFVFGRKAREQRKQRAVTR